jgi:peptidoglycan-associated lipoprotein
VDAGRIETVSYGEERPVAQGHDEGAWSQNRRAEFEITAAPATIRQP